MAKEPAGRDLSLHAEDVRASLSIFSMKEVFPASQHHSPACHILSPRGFVASVSWEQPGKVGVGTDPVLAGQEKARGRDRDPATAQVPGAGG